MAHSFFNWVDKVTTDMRAQVEKYRADVERLEHSAAPPAKECAVTFCGREDCAEAALVPVCSSGHVMHWKCVEDFVKTAIKNNSDDYNDVEIQIACPLCRDDFLGKLVYLIRCIAADENDPTPEPEQHAQQQHGEGEDDDDDDDDEDDFRAFSLSLALLGSDPVDDDDDSTSTSSSSSESSEEEEAQTTRKRQSEPPAETEERRPIVRRRVITVSDDDGSSAAPPPNFTYDVDTEAPAESFDMHIRSEARQGTGSRVIRHFAHRPRRRRPGILPRVHGNNNAQPGSNN